MTTAALLPSSVAALATTTTAAAPGAGIDWKLIGLLVVVSIVVVAVAWLMTSKSGSGG